MKKVESKVLKTNIIPAVVAWELEDGNFLERTGYSKF